MNQPSEPPLLQHVSELCGDLPGNRNGSDLGRTVSVLRVARALRVLRTARIVRVARYMPELMMLSSRGPWRPGR